jgi:3-deoxy-7-phosphoheptulonate synthase
VEEWLLAGEYLLAHGAEAVIFCERGLRGFDPQTRNLLDLGAVALLKHTYGLPVVVDPSHAAGRRDLIAPLSRAALAVGADGVMVEAHPNAACAMSDGPQALNSEELSALGATLRALSPSLQAVPPPSQPQGQPPHDDARHGEPSPLSARNVYEHLNAP